MALAELQSATSFVASLALAVWHWKYLAQTLFGLVVLIWGAIFCIKYREWRRAWLSDLVEREIEKIRRSSPPSAADKSAGYTPSFVYRALGNYTFRGVHSASDYLFRGGREAARTPYIPSITSVLLILVPVCVVLFLANPPTHLGSFLHPLTWWDILKSALADKEGMPHAFEALIVVGIALVVFVAESVRGSVNSDQKRVLLKLSNLWILVLLLTLSPLVFLYPPSIGVHVLLALALAIFALVSFARVLLNLLDGGSALQAEREFLRDRARRVVLNSARERVGNKLLYDRLGGKRESPVGFTLGFGLPGDERRYEFVEAPKTGRLVDINLKELSELGRLLQGAKSELSATPQATSETEITSGPGLTKKRRSTGNDQRAHLIRRFGEELPAEAVSPRDKAILAVPLQIAADKALVREVRRRTGHVFKFSDAEPSSAAFRREMQSTKDRLVSAINRLSLGEVDDLKDTYFVVAREFVNVLNDLGGAYTAEQARAERSNAFEEWTEVRWLVRDVRQLLIAAAATDNTDVIASITSLPYAIASRAIRSGDQLLFQDFLGFGSFIYDLGAEKPSGRVRDFLIDRSWRYLKEVAEFQIQPLLSEDAPSG